MLINDALQTGIFPVSVRTKYLTVRSLVFCFGLSTLDLRRLTGMISMQDNRVASCFTLSVVE
uniref:Uncharacterized protein n=1 Tax=Anguilla anguilla TaxID=7936 RepID=A0A0E9WEG5_ANGAN